MILLFQHFFSSSDDTIAQQPKSKTIDLFANQDDDDDFNPRGTGDTMNANNNPNGDFGDFESAFGTSGNTNVSNNKAASSMITNTTAIGTGNNGGDGFADFSSAFGSGSNPTTPSSSSRLPAPPTPPPTATNPPSSIDLFGGASTSASGPSSNLDLLGGLVMNNPPPLMGMPPMGSGGAMASPVHQITTQLPTTNNDLFGAPVMMMGGGAQPPNMMSSNNNFNLMANSTAASTTSSNTTSMMMNKKSTMWDNVGNVNIDLNNLSLKGQNQKKGLPMNAMVTPNSSPQRMPPPAGQGPAQGLGMAPPPLKAVQSPAGNNPGPATSGFDSLNDLLN